MQKIFAFGLSTILFIVVAIILFGVSLGIVFQVPNFDRFAPNLLFLVVTACLSLAESIRRISKAKTETSIKVPKGASPAVIEAIKALDSNNSSERENAIQNLTHMSDPTARLALVSATIHPHKDVRFQAAFKLAELGDNSSIPAITEALNDDNWEIAARAGDALGILGGNASREGLIKALKHNDPRIRRHAAAYLGQPGLLSTHSINSLLNSLETDAEWQVRQAAAISLGEIGDKRVVSDLLALLDKEKERNVIEGIIIALGKLGDGNIVPILLPIFKRENNTTAMITALVTALRRIGTPEALAAVEPYRDHWNYWVHDI